MTQDPLSHVAVAADDPVLALIAEKERLDALWIAADEIRFKHPEDIGTRQAVKAIALMNHCIDEQMGAILDQICNTKPVTLAGAIAMLELGRQGDCDDERLINAAIAGLRDMQREASREAGETAGDPLPIDTAPINPDEDFCCLLWAPPWRAAANDPPYWHLGRWSEGNWCDDEEGGIIFPTHWHPLPKPGPIAEEGGAA